ncbi:hypothetical protein HNP85_001627 [Methanococcus maripaludis]|uniref:Uncharacterized protein n=1 Tax=Methanococcus maripaludis TaxID=39152 RepID=A0A8T4CPQ5_METMI|nr:hypothetical protein [Methanococcus maripaludis]MBP2219262.1 hypothetical protein [Methanococcus maripaludis]
MQLPTAVPTANPGDPESAAPLLVTISGREVPNATIVAPITKFETLKCFATEYFLQ